MKGRHMAIQRDDPYSAFNFRVVCDRLSGGDSSAAGFQEVSGLGMEVSVTEYRNGNEASNTVRKVTGLTRVPDVTLKRGVAGSLDFFNWIREVRDGEDARSTVIIELLDESRSNVVMAWRLTHARPVKYVGPTLTTAEGADIAIEELVLAYERLDME